MQPYHPNWQDRTPEEHAAYFRAEIDPGIKKVNIKISTLHPIIPRVHRHIAG